MKKIQLALTIAAIVTASSAVFATKIIGMGTVYFINDPTAQTGHSCDTPVQENCDPGEGAICTSSNLSPSQPVWFNVNGSDCNQLMKPQ